MTETNALLGLLSPHQRMRMGQMLMAGQYDRPGPSMVPDDSHMHGPALTQGPAPGYNNRLADMLRGYGLLGPAERLNNPYTPESNVTGLVGAIAGPAVSGWNRLWQNGYTPGTGDTAGVEAAFDAAGGALTGSLMAPRPRNALGTFGGRLAKTADLEALARAEAMDAAGKPREDIWKDTGWFKGVDGKWRFEIDDSKSAWTYGDQTAGELFNKFSHNGLLKSYPDLGDARLSRDARGGSGLYAAPFASKPETIAIGRVVDDTRSVLLHELQHGLQRREGFAQGAAPEQMTFNEIVDLKAGLRKLPEPQRSELTRRIFDASPDEQRFHAYMAHAGEVEARAVQKRMDMTPDERRARPPWLNYDVPEDVQIVRRP